MELMHDGFNCALLFGALRCVGRTLRQAQDVGLERALQREADAQAVCYASKEFADRLAKMQADMQKKK
jgi:hypothetical protein